MGKSDNDFPSYRDGYHIEILQEGEWRPIDYADTLEEALEIASGYVGEIAWDFNLWHRDSMFRLTDKEGRVVC